MSEPAKPLVKLRILFYLFSFATSEMDFTRDELLLSLASMGVELPLKTKQTNAALKKLLHQALDCAQQWKTLSSSPQFTSNPTPESNTVAITAAKDTNANPLESEDPTSDSESMNADDPGASVDPSNLENWPVDDKKRLATLMSKFNYVDMFQQGWDVEGNGDAFTALRRALAFVADKWAHGNKTVLVYDRGHLSIIIIEVRELFFRSYSSYLMPSVTCHA